ncbi:transporter substrate-binding domain-containing protein [Pseudomonas sp. CCM 7893]|uniref:histidine kinase n=1 Tax=Pseudomonas spelaei TaxID=1055469 RepID=A0A6I3WA90_9PSED|nr:ATP-binding protein [Pseudomonas spelaei]MUF03626.1 transporter substrate-binding domain-containing protein [Pseudomonas spelaei]
MSWLARIAAPLLVLLVWGLPFGVQESVASVELTAEEQEWIKQQPPLRVGVVEKLIPFEYLSEAQLHGLSAQYLDFVTRETGLKFIYVPGGTTKARINALLQGQVDLLSFYPDNTDAQTPAVRALPPYHTSAVVIVTRVGGTEVLKLQQLAGKTVVIPDVERYVAMFNEQGVKAHLIKSKSVLEMLTMVKDGTADAAVDSEIFLIPYLYRQFQGILHLSGVVGNEQVAVGMAVRADHVMLYSILDKTLEAISAEQRKEIYQQWFRALDLDIPSMRTITRHYLHVFILGGVALIILFVLVYQSHRQRRLAVRSDQEKALFLAVMSHEIRSPMNAVLAAVELLGNTPLDEQQRRYTQLANSCANTLLRLLDDVLDVSRLEAGQLSLSVEAVDVQALIQDVVDLHWLHARGKNLQLNVSAKAHLPLLLMDGTRLAQIFHNLISNAIKFTDAGGIEISLGLMEAKIGQDRQLVIEVRDTGIGISASVQASLFRPYAQASHSYKRSGGTGLGLVICRQLVSLMQGKLELGSEPGIGTTVTISLPVAPAQDCSAGLVDEALLAQPLASTHSGLRILVVEDSLANQEMLRVQLSSFGCWPVMASNAAQALVLFSETPFNLVLMNCVLPDQEGYSLARELRNVERQLHHSHCPIIALSALTGIQLFERCFDAGMDGVLNTPLHAAKLREVIELWCEVTLVAPSEASLEVMLDQTAVTREMARDLGSLIKASALRDYPVALHAVNRLQSTALILDWTGLATAGEALEDLLRADMCWDDPGYLQALKELVQHWQVLGGDQSFDALPRYRP